MAGDVRRAHISLKTKLAAALCTLFKIPHMEQMAMSEDQVLSLVNWDHYPRTRESCVAEAALAGGMLYHPDAHYNLMPRLIKEHREKTAKIDAPALAKHRRISKANEEFRRRLLAKDTGEPIERKSRWGKRKIQSRNNLRNNLRARSRP